MDYADEYKSKLKTAKEAMELVKSGDWVEYGLGLNVPELLDEALSRRAGELFDIKVRGALALHPLAVVENDPGRRSFTYNSWHMSGLERKYHDRNLCNYIPMTFRYEPIFYERHLEVDVACVNATPMNKQGWFNLSLTCAATRAALRKAKKVILEVNENLPWAMGGFDESIHISDVDAVVEGPHQLLPTLAPVPAAETDITIAKSIVERLRDESVIQLGIGGMPNTVGQMIAQSDLKDLGMHTEMLCDAYLDMYKAGKLTNKKKRINRDKGLWTFCLGSQELYDWVDNNPGLSLVPVDYANSPYVMSRHARMVSINNCIEVDLFGQTCAESSGIRHISGSGGQLDFLTGAFMAEEGQGFICMSSTFFDKKEERVKSRIVPTLPAGSIVTDPRTQMFYLATEFGIVNLAGRSTWERAERIISVAHPDFREELIKQADNMKIWRKTNKR